MTKHVFVLICLLLATQFAACSTRTVKVDGFSSPESVISDGTYFYVSNVGKELKPMDRDGDGYISRLSDEGRVLERRFISGLNAPKGMAVLDDVLYVADIDHIKGFDLSNGEKVFDLDFSGAGTSFLNDITVISDQELLVSATDTGNLYLVRTGSDPRFEKIESDADLAGPNGLCFVPEDNTVYIASYGRNNKPDGVVGRAEIRGGRLVYEKISSREGYYDGIAVYKGRVIVSDWIAYQKAGELVSIDPESGRAVPLELGEKIGGPADFYLDRKGKRLWIPMMMENKVLITAFQP